MGYFKGEKTETGLIAKSGSKSLHEFKKEKTLRKREREKDTQELREGRIMKGHIHLQQLRKRCFKQMTSLSWKISMGPGWSDCNEVHYGYIW